MLKLSISEQAEKFRTEFRRWLEVNPLPKLDDGADLDQFISTARACQKDLAKGNWVGVHWPTQYGGRGMSLIEEAVVQEELVRVESPQLLGLFGLTMVGPVLIKHGNEAQRTRFLPKILSAEEIWCQGFSEPNAGSDLASVQTKAEIVADGFAITGQKVWTSFAQIADWCFVLCRTDAGSKRHHGLSYLLVDMKSKGILTRPLKQISGDNEFNEVFFDQVFVPRENLVGELGDGWKIAISTLMYERVVLTFARQLQSEVALRSLVREFGKTASESLRTELAYEVARAAAIRSLAYEHLLKYAAGGAPGPEGSMDKLAWSESFQSIAKLARKLHGQDSAYSEVDSKFGTDQHRYLYSRGRTIAAGTSEIQRNIIAERILELPRPNRES